MRKIILLFVCFLLAVQFSMSQVQYEKAIELNYSHGLSEYSKYAIGVDMINGVRLNEFLFMGLGVGFKYADALYIKSYNADKIISNDESRDSKYLIPIYLRLKTNFTKQSVSPFFVGSIGYTIDVTGSPNEMKGLMFEPMFGVDFNLLDGKTTMYTSLGAQFQQAQYQYFFLSSTSQSYNETVKGLAGFVSLKFGIKF